MTEESVGLGQTGRESGAGGERGVWRLSQWLGVRELGSESVGWGNYEDDSENRDILQLPQVKGCVKITMEINGNRGYNESSNQQKSAPVQDTQRILVPKTKFDVGKLLCWMCCPAMAQARCVYKFTPQVSGKGQSTFIL
jgi:hypothetical protein